MKQPIQWHKDCLKNLTASALRKREEANRVRDDADRIEAMADVQAHRQPTAPEPAPMAAGGELQQTAEPLLALRPSVAPKLERGDKPCRHGNLACGQGYWDCGKCSYDRRKAAYRRLTPEQKAYDNLVDPLGAYHTDFDRLERQSEDGCSCHINPPCSYCVSQPSEESEEGSVIFATNRKAAAGGGGAERQGDAPTTAEREANGALTDGGLSHE
jgi:hypothetical protein